MYSKETAKCDRCKSYREHRIEQGVNTGETVLTCPVCHETQPLR